MRGNTKTSREKRAELTAAAQDGVGECGECLNGWDVQSKRIYSPDGAAPTLSSGTNEGMNIQPSVLSFDTAQMTHPANGSNPQPGDASPTLTTSAQSPCIALQSDGTTSTNSHGNGFQTDGSAYTLSTIDRQSVCTQYGDVAGALVARGDSSPCADRGADVVCMASGQGGAEVYDELSPAQAARQHKDPQIVCIADDTANSAIDDDLCGTLKTGGSIPSIVQERTYIVRRLTPLECERLQGFPDGWTDIQYRGKPAPDTARYKALGNSMAVPVIEWIGKRIEIVDRMLNENAD